MHFDTATLDVGLVFSFAFLFFLLCAVCSGWAVKSMWMRSEVGGRVSRDCDAAWLGTDCVCGWKGLGGGFVGVHGELEGEAQLFLLCVVVLFVVERVLEGV